MKVIKYFSIVSFLISNYLSAQVGINIENPLPATSLHIDGSDAGVLINKVSLDDINDDTLGTETLDMTYEGLMVYNTNTSNTGNPESDVLPGFYFWNGSSWRIIGQSTKKRSGWVSLIDGDYSINLPFVNSPELTDFSNFTNIELDFENDASDAIIESFAPTGYSASDLFDSSGNRITPITLGDTILLRLQFDAAPNNGNGVIVIQLDIGANDIAGDGDDIVCVGDSGGVDGRVGVGWGDVMAPLRLQETYPTIQELVILRRLPAIGFRGQESAKMIRSTIQSRSRSAVVVGSARRCLHQLQPVRQYIKGFSVRHQHAQRRWLSRGVSITERRHRQALFVTAGLLDGLLQGGKLLLLSYLYAIQVGAPFVPVLMTVNRFSLPFVRW